MTRSKVSTSELKAHCSSIIESVARKRLPVVITKRGCPVARLVPVEGERESLFGFAKGCILIHGDIMAPVDATWEATG
jgi:prevent-host-death family protein